MLRNNHFPLSETKIKKSVLGEARVLSESFGIFEIVRVVFSQSAGVKTKNQDFWEILGWETISKMLRNNHFPISETKIKKCVLGEARVLSGSFGIKLLARLVNSQSALPKNKIDRRFHPRISGFIGYRYNPFINTNLSKYTLFQTETRYQVLYKIF